MTTFITVSLAKPLKDEIGTASIGGVSLQAALVLERAYALYVAAAHPLTIAAVSGRLSERDAELVLEALRYTGPARPRVNITLSVAAKQVIADYRTLDGAFSPSVQGITDAAVNFWLACARRATFDDAGEVVREIIGSAINPSPAQHGEGMDGER